MQGPGLTTGLQSLLFDMHLFCALGLRHFLELGEVRGRAVTEAHRAGVARLIELDFEIAAIPTCLRLVRIGMDQGKPRVGAV